MRGIVAYVKFHLKVHMAHNPQFFSAFPNTELHAHPPLDIRASLSENGLLSYKAKWSKDQALMALTSTDMYEAGGNIFWINPFTSDATEKVCAGDCPSWETVTMMMAQVFRPTVGASTPDGKLAKSRRLRFTVDFVVFAQAVKSFCGHDSFPGTLKLVFGHAALWGWYVAAFEALDAAAPDMVALLWQAALTPTIQAHIVTDTSQLALHSMKANNVHQLHAAALTDSFPSFAKKLHLALTTNASTPCPKTVPQRLQFCQNQDIRYNAAPVHRTLLLAVYKYVETVDDSCHERLRRLEHKYGKDVLSGRWNTLNRLLQICSTEADRMWNGLRATRSSRSKKSHRSGWTKAATGHPER